MGKLRLVVVAVQGGPLVDVFLVMRLLSTVMETSASAKEAATEVNEDDDGRQITIQDEGPADEVVNERSAVSEVTLPSTIRKSYLLSVFV